MVLRVTEKIKIEKRERTAIPNRIISEALTERGILEQKRFGSMKQNTPVVIRGKSIPGRGNSNYKHPKVAAGNEGRARRSL